MVVRPGGLHQQAGLAAWHGGRVRIEIGPVLLRWDVPAIAAILNRNRDRFRRGLVKYR